MENLVDLAWSRELKQRLTDLTSSMRPLEPKQVYQVEAEFPNPVRHPLQWRRAGIKVVSLHSSFKSAVQAAITWLEESQMYEDCPDDDFSFDEIIPSGGARYAAYRVQQLQENIKHFLGRLEMKEDGAVFSMKEDGVGGDEVVVRIARKEVLE